MTPKHLWSIGARSVRSGTSRVFAVRALGLGALFALEMTLGRRLGLAGYGAFAFVLVVATVIAHMAPLGWLNASTRLIRNYTSANLPALLKGSLITAHVTTVAGLVIAGIALFALAASGVRPETVGLLRLALPLGIALTAIELHRYILRGQHAAVRGESMTILLLPLGVLCGIWALGLASVGSVVLAYVVVCGLLAALSTVWIARRLPPGLGPERAHYQVRSWSGIAAAMLLGTAADEMTARAAVLILGALDTNEAVGLFQAAARLSLMTIFVLRAVTAVAAPRIAELYHAGRHAEVRSLYARTCFASACGAAPLLLIYCLRPELALGLFGADFEQGAPILRVLAIGYFVSAAAGPCATTLMMIGHERTYGTLAVLGLGLNVAGMLLLVPTFGALGAATVAAFATIVVNLCYALAILRATRPRGGVADAAAVAERAPVASGDVD